MSDRYAVAGHPIAHSRSPLIHGLFASQTGEAITYEALDVPPAEFQARIGAFRRAGGRGLNLTVPLKELGYEGAERLSERAARARAVNTLRFEDDGTVFGDNTDGVGLVRDLTANLGIRIEGARVLLVGAGGAARGVLGPMLDLAPARLTVANRTPGKAMALVEDFRGQDSRGVLRGCALDAIPSGPWDLVVNATAASLSGEALPLGPQHLSGNTCCYDMMYAAGPTRFLRHARSLGVEHRADGRGMLVEQAAEAFRVWRGVAPDTGPVIRALAESLDGD